MQYLLLIYAAEDAGPQPGDADYAEFMGGYYAFTQDVKKRGLFQGGEPLEKASTATTVRVRDGQTSITDGPFAETKEVLGGFYLLDCKDLDEALECASNIPSAKHGSIEVRPIMQIPAMDASG